MVVLAIFTASLNGLFYSLITVCCLEIIDLLVQHYEEREDDD